MTLVTRRVFGLDLLTVFQMRGDVCGVYQYLQHDHVVPFKCDKDV